MNEKNKTQKKREKGMKKKRRLKALEASENKFVIETVNGIEIAYASRKFEDIVTDKNIRHINNLSRIAIDQFNRVGRGAFLIISDANPNEGVFLSSQKLCECIEQVIPEALNYVQIVVNEYDPKAEFVVINAFSSKRIGISRDALRFSD